MIRFSFFAVVFSCLSAFAVAAWPRATGIRLLRMLLASLGLISMACAASAATVATPTFSPAAGTYANTQTVTIATTTSGATIRYTTNGTTPTATTGTVYSAPVSITATTTLKAIAYKSGSTNSSVRSGTYTLKAATPTFSPTAGTYTGAQSVTIATTTSGATIRYTTNGSTPSATSGTVYTTGTPVPISATTTLKAIAYKTGYTKSTVLSGTYTINPAVAPAITMQPASQAVTVGQSVSFTAVVSGTAPLTYQWKKGGTAISGATSATYTLSSAVANDAGSYTLTATNAAGSVTSNAAILSISNQLPTVTLTAPTANASFTLPATVTLTATASDPDGSITKVEFFNGTASLGAKTVAPYTLTWAPTAPGLVSLTAKATDNATTPATTTSAAVSITLLPSLPYTADFETSEGYALGSLNNQLGWSVSAGAAQIVSGSAASGTQYVNFTPGTSAAVVNQEFGSAIANPSVAFVDFYAQPVAGTDAATGTLFDLDAARIVCVLNGNVGQLQALDGDGLGSGTWKSLAPAIPLSTGNTASTWQRITVRLNTTAKTYDLYLNGAMIAADLKFRVTVTPYLSWFSIKGHTAASATLDDLYAGATNPLFADTNNNGIDDTWETAHGLSLFSDNRNDDSDDDGLTNVQEYILGTDPHFFDHIDSDKNGLPDDWEMKYFGHIGVDANADDDGDGLTNLQEYKLGRNPTKPALSDTTSAVNLRLFLPLN